MQRGIRRLSSDHIERLRIFERADRQGRRHVVIIALFCDLRRLRQTQTEAGVTALAALRDLFKPFYRVVKFLRVEAAGEEADLMIFFSVLPGSFLFLPVAAPKAS